MTAKTTGILFDINQFLQFDLDEEMKRKICFSETLLVSCMHNKKIQPPLNKNIESPAEFESEEIHGESLDEEELQKNTTPVPSDDDFFFYFYDKKLPDKDKPTEYDNLMNINGIPTLNPNRKKVRCTCSKDNWKAVCTCGAPSEDELSPVPDALSTSSESELSEDVDIYDRKKERQCRCSSTGTIMDECKCGAELDKLKRKSLPKIKRITIDAPEASSTNEGSLKKGTYSFSGEKTYSFSGEGTPSLTTQSSLSIVTRSEMSEENSSPVKSLSFTTESSLSTLTPGETSKETESLVKISEISLNLDDFGGCLKTLITPENCTTSGGLTLSVETIGVSHDKFLVHKTSQYIANGYDAGTELLSKVDLNLHTMEENKAEYRKRKKSHEFFENELYAAICESGYFCSTTTREGDSKKHESKYISYDDAYTFVLDGSNIILLRYLALTQFEGKLTTTYLDMSGNIGESSYVSKIVPNAIVNNQEMPVLQVGRINLSGLGYETSECYVFTLLGYLVQHQWSDSNIVVHINPLLPVDPVTNQICRQIPLRNNWQEDMQILSNYFDFKDRRLMENESYLAGKVQLQSILTDYFQTILLMKPRDVVPFTISFFSSFDKSITLPHNSYFDKNCQRVRYSSL